MKRIFLFMTIPVCAFLLLVAFAFVGVEIYLSGMRQSAVHLMHTLREYANKAEQKGQSIESEAFIRSLSEAAGLRVTLFSGEGKLLADSDSAGLKPPDFFPAVNMMSLENGIISYSISSYGNLYVLNQFTTIPSESADHTSYIICASIPLVGYDKLLLVRNAVIIAGGVLLAAAALFCLLWTKSSKRRTVAVPESGQGLIRKINQIELYANKRISMLSTALSNMDSGIILFGPDCSILMMNPKARSLTGAKSSLFFPDQANRESEYPPVLTAILDMVRESMQRNQSLLRDLHTEDGKILSVHTNIVYSKYVPYTFYGVHASITDVTEKRKMEKVRDEFVSNVSHELRTPLTLISGFAETLQDWKKLNREDFKRAIEIINTESRRLKHMISQLLDLSRIESRHGTQRHSVIDPVHTVRSVVSSISALAEKHQVRFEAVFPDQSAEMFGDEASVVQIVTNLCENAIKYTPSGGHVSLTVFRDGLHLCIRVADDGIGIPEAEIPHIFDRFYRVEKSRNTKYGGSGLGLSITKALVDDLGGSISVESRLHAGSTFTVRLPLLNAEPLRQEAT